ncbi:hypothetical protein TNCV_3055631 [Trichonephila clavipes]|nr:hypothetical protein TNCV_3055631 [Trichonephila clavipes]
MWSMVAQRLTQITPPAATPDHLWQRVEAAWSAVLQEHIQSLFESMPMLQDKSDPVNDETDEDDNNNKSSTGPSNADAFSALEIVVRTTIKVLSYSTTAAQENQRPCSEKTKVYNGTAENK